MLCPCQANLWVSDIVWPSGLGNRQPRSTSQLTAVNPPFTTLQVQRTGFGSSVKLINADTNTALRSCGLGEEVRDTVLEDGSPAGRWSLMPCDVASCLYALRPTSDTSEVKSSQLSACFCAAPNRKSSSTSFKQG